MALQPPGPNKAKFSNIFSTPTHGRKTKCIIALYQNCKSHGPCVRGSDIVCPMMQQIHVYRYVVIPVPIPNYYNKIIQFFWHGVSDAERERYLNCDVYTDSAEMPTQNTICHRHFTQRKFYCRTWQCETPRCPLNQQIPRARDCPYCPSKQLTSI